MEMRQDYFYHATLLNGHSGIVFNSSASLVFSLSIGNYEPNFFLGILPPLASQRQASPVAVSRPVDALVRHAFDHIPHFQCQRMTALFS